MNLCSEKHDEVCFEGRDCPVCEMINDMEAEVEALKEELKETK